MWDIFKVNQLFQKVHEKISEVQLSVCLGNTYNREYYEKLDKKLDKVILLLEESKIDNDRIDKICIDKTSSDMHARMHHIEGRLEAVDKRLAGIQTGFFELQQRQLKWEYFLKLDLEKIYGELVTNYKDSKLNNIVRCQDDLKSTIRDVRSGVYSIDQKVNEMIEYTNIATLNTSDKKTDTTSLDELIEQVDSRSYTRIKNVLSNEGIYTVEELINSPNVKYLKIPNFGRTSLRDLKEAMKKFDLHFVC